MKEVKNMQMAQVGVYGNFFVGRIAERAWDTKVEISASHEKPANERQADPMTFPSSKESASGLIQPVHAPIPFPQATTPCPPPSRNISVSPTRLPSRSRKW
jgi:hypothetical protein